ncbi:TlpA disulfide reductase family protein [Mucilaginibacter jinjuensis]|uniref:TlpA disulfide reductase family protein n=1 Tax=Mucilaginibacter jinjuensis TaxID=1176721 RepID=A0ABY7TAS5_9SPHI|nr:TlpA disulfide reductase family protein [Mucilaginibacter jinjuensis]WCT13413.1 TlpA disulfide reductase family protein [Mucilaginibacter jinjuensis]
MKAKNLILASVATLFAGSVFAQTSSSIVFSGKTDTAYNGKMVILYNKITGDHDSTLVANGRFEMTVPYKEPSRYMFYSKYEVRKKGGYAPFGIIVTKPGTVQLNADMETFTNSTVPGNKENDLYLSFIKESAPAREQIIDKLSAKYGADFSKHLNQKDPLYGEVNQYYNDLNAEFNKGQVERLGLFIQLHPESFTALYLLNSMITVVPADKAQLYYNELVIAYKTTSYALNIQKSIDAKNITAIGKLAPDFEQPDTSGKMVKLSDFRGQYVLVDFWASWCIPCREENPNVVKAYSRFHKKGFTVLSVSLDQPGKKESWLNAIHHDQLTWTQVSDLKFWNNAVAKLYGIQAIPQNFLLDKEGKIIAVNIKGNDLQNKLLELFPQ